MDTSYCRFVVNCHLNFLISSVLLVLFRYLWIDLCTALSLGDMYEQSFPRKTLSFGLELVGQLRLTLWEEDEHACLDRHVRESRLPIASLSSTRSSFARHSFIDDIRRIVI